MTIRMHYYYHDPMIMVSEHFVEIKNEYILFLMVKFFIIIIKCHLQ